MAAQREPSGAEWRPSAIAFDHVTKRYPGAALPAVDDITLTVKPGSIVVLLGPSGCGKTTLLKMVNRLYEPTAGRILIDDVDISTVPAPALRRRIGYVIQQTGLFPHLRVADNVAVVPRLLGWDKARIRARVDTLLELVGLPPAGYRRRYPAQLSGGEAQRVGLARALAAEPSTLLMDEPFGALDAITRARLQEELRRVHAGLGQTVLFVTHDIEEAIRLADEIVVMRLGRVVQHDTPLRIVMSPADDFVADLVGARDVLRRLSLITAGSVARPALAPIGAPSIGAAGDLRAALSLLLSTGIDAVAVQHDEVHLGVIDLGTIRAAAAPPVPVGAP